MVNVREITSQVTVVNNLFTYPNGTQGLQYVNQTGNITMTGLAAFQAMYVRITPVACTGQPCLMWELYTPCAYAEYFGWQQGAGYYNTNQPQHMPALADWSFVGGVQDISGSYSTKTLALSGLVAICAGSGLVMTAFPPSVGGATWRGPALDTTNYVW